MNNQPTPQQPATPAPQPQPAVQPQPVAQPQPQPQQTYQYQQPAAPVPQPQPTYQYQQPAAPAPQPTPYAYPVRYDNPGETLGVIGCVLSFFGISIGGILLGIISRNKSKEAGMSTTRGNVSLGWGIFGSVCWCLIWLFWILVFVGVLSKPSWWYYYYY